MFEGHHTLDFGALISFNVVDPVILKSPDPRVVYWVRDSIDS